VRKMPYKTWFLAGMFLLAPLVSEAAGLGKLTILSALGQPLSAEIDLVSVQKDELSSLVIRLAPPESFTRANITFSPALIGARLSIEKRADGQPYAKITSSRSVNEPFISMLIELSWARGRLVREYTALIDPPNVPSTAVAAPPPAVVAPAVAEPAPAPVVALATPAATASKPAAAAYPAQAKPAAPAAPANREYGPVKRGETLARIAANLKQDGVTAEQMLVGLYRSNPEAFSGNMNRLKSGQILRVPERERLVETAPADAVKEVRVQTANWNAYRQKVADGAGASPASETRAVARGKIAAVDDKAAAKEAPKEVVKLSKGEAAPDGGKAGKGAVAAKDRIRALEDEATVREKSLAEANNRIADLEKNIKDMQRLLALKGGVPAAKPEAAPAPAPKPEPAKAAPPKAEAPKAEPVKEPVKAEPPKEASKAEPAKDAVKAEPAKELEKAPEPPKAAEPAPKPKPKIIAPPPPPPEPDLLDQLMDPLYLGGAGLLAALGVGGYLFARRRRARADDGDEKQEPKKAAAPGAAAAPMAAAPVMAQASVDDVDPLAEADLYLNFGRDTQAEEVLKDALAKNPNHEEAKLKLLQIYASRKDKDAFEKLAKDLHVQTGGAGDNWIKAAGMGYALDAGNALYEAGKSAPAAELPATGAAAGTDLDFDLELAPDGSVAGTSTDVELDVGKTMSLSATDMAALGVASDPSETVDVTADSGAARAIADSDAPDFTLNRPAETPVAGAAPDFDLDAPLSVDEPSLDETTRTNVRLEAGSGGNMIDFNFEASALNQPASAAAAEQPFTPDGTVIMSPEAAAEVPALDVDFDLGKTTALEEPAVPAMLPEFNLELPADLGEPDKTAAPAVESLMPDLKLDDISLNFNINDLPKTEIPAEAVPAAEGVKDDRWYDVQTKFDLAKAYQEMGDKDGAREILQEVIKEGDAAQQAEAKSLLESLA
jgi:pilus assembly protein FimV